MLSRLCQSAVFCLGLSLSGCAVSEWDVRGYEEPRYYRNGYEVQRYPDVRYRQQYPVIQYRVYPAPVYYPPRHHHYQRHEPRVYGGWPPGHWQMQPGWRHEHYREARRDHYDGRDWRHDGRHDRRDRYDGDRKRHYSDRERDEGRGWSLSR